RQRLRRRDRHRRRAGRAAHAERRRLDLRRARGHVLPLLRAHPHVLLRVVERAGHLRRRLLPRGHVAVGPRGRGEHRRLQLRPRPGGRRHGRLGRPRRRHRRVLSRRAGLRPVHGAAQLLDRDDRRRHDPHRLGGAVDLRGPRRLVLRHRGRRRGRHQRVGGGLPRRGPRRRAGHRRRAVRGLQRHVHAGCVGRGGALVRAVRR
ncbi:MAG: hypothetical protein ACK56I_07040, partial [bacterium]